MSTSKEFDRFPKHATLGDLMRHFGADDADLAAAGPTLEAIVRRVEAFWEWAKPAVLALATRLETLSQEPETPGHEKLFKIIKFPVCSRDSIAW